MRNAIRQFIWRVLFGPKIEVLYARSRSAWKKGGVWRFWAIYLQKKIARRFGCYLSPKATVGKNLTLKHPVGIVIGDGVVIGDNVTIYQNVTLGAGKVKDGGLYPVVEDNVVIYAGAKLVGRLRVGRQAVVGANAVVLSDVPQACVAVGIPAKVLGTQISNTLVEAAAAV